MHSGLTIAFAILLAALGFLIVPSAYHVIYVPVAGVLLLVAIVTALRTPRRERPVEPPRPAADDTPDEAPGTALPFAVDAIDDLTTRYNRLSFALPLAVPLAFVIRRRRNALLTDALVRNTLVGAEAFEYELRPMMAGREEIDDLLTIAASHREFLKAFLQPEVMEEVVGCFTSESIYLVELSCRGDAVSFIFQPELDTLPAGMATQLIARYETIVADLSSAIIDQAHRFSS